MTATNHAVTGAAIAVLVPEPLAAIGLALISHFILDAIPHFGIHEDDIPRRNRHWLFRTVISTDILAVIVLLICLPFVVHVQPRWVLDAAMLAGIVPDAIWVTHYIKERRNGMWPEDGAYARWHQKIQWYEKPRGLIVEAIWLTVMGLIIGLA
jgi:hypothetical protein